MNVHYVKHTHFNLFKNVINLDLESYEVSSLNSYNSSEVGSISSINVFPNSNNNKEYEECCINGKLSILGIFIVYLCF